MFVGDYADRNDLLNFPPWLVISTWKRDNARLAGANLPPQRDPEDPPLRFGVPPNPFKGERGTMMILQDTSEGGEA
jgi:hypothetical protein